MNGILPREQFHDFLNNTRELTATQRLILMTYWLSADDPTGVLVKTGVDIAELLNLRPTVFSRLRRQLVAEGYLEESARHRLGNIRYYGLTRKTTGGDNVVIPLRRTAN